MDEAIRRRCDLEVYFPYAVDSQIIEILKANYPHISTEIVNEFVSLTRGYNLRMSDIESFILYQRINSRLPDTICKNIDILLERGIKI